MLVDGSSTRESIRVLLGSCGCAELKGERDDVALSALHWGRNETPGPLLFTSGHLLQGVNGRECPCLDRERCARFCAMACTIITCMHQPNILIYCADARVVFCRVNRSWLQIYAPDECAVVLPGKGLGPSKARVLVVSVRNAISLRMLAACLSCCLQSCVVRGL